MSRKAWFKGCGPGFQIRKETCLHAKAYLCINVIRHYLAFISYTVYGLLLPVNGLLTWV